MEPGIWFGSTGPFGFEVVSTVSLQTLTIVFSAWFRWELANSSRILVIFRIVKDRIISDSEGYKDSALSSTLKICGETAIIPWQGHTFTAERRSKHLTFQQPLSNYLRYGTFDNRRHICT